MSASPFDDIHALIAGLPPMPAPALPPDPGLGRLGELLAWLSRWRGPRPTINRPILAIYAASHGVAGRTALGLEPDAVRARLEAIAAGQAPANRLAQGQGAGLEAFDLAIDRPVGDIVARPAMSERDCAATMAFGMEALAKQPDLLLLGAVASGGQIAAEAITLALFGGEAGDGMTPENAIAVEAAGRARAAIGADPDPLQILRQLGGRETAALAGAILAARSQGVPVVLGGYGAAAAAAILWRADPRTIQHVLAGDAGATPAAGALVRRIGLEPLTAFGVADGEGLGALAALPVLRLACNAAG